MGKNTLEQNKGKQNVAIGASSMKNSVADGDNKAVNNTAIGFNSLLNVSGERNVAVGANAGKSITTGSGNIVVGFHNKNNDPKLTEGDNNILIGNSANIIKENDNDSIVIGTGAVGEGNNTTVIGNKSNKSTSLTGTLKIKTGEESNPGSLIVSGDVTVEGGLSVSPLVISEEEVGGTSTKTIKLNNYTWPTGSIDVNNDGKVLQTDASGTLTWQNQSVLPEHDNTTDAGKVLTAKNDGTYFWNEGVASTSANKLTIERNIGGVPFDGSADINLPGVNITGTQNTTGNAASASTAESGSALESALNNKQAIVANVSDTEIGYLDGVTSAIQTQIDSKQATINGAATTIASSDLTASRALVSNGTGKVEASAVTSTELGYLDGVTSAIQTQLDAKQAIDDKPLNRLNDETLTVTVGTKNTDLHPQSGGSSSAYFINGKEAPILTFLPGKKYIFDVSDSSNSNHPLRFYENEDKTGGTYDTGVTIGTGQVSITISESTTSRLYYQCGSHAYMGNYVSIMGKVNLNYLDINTLGTSQASKAVTADASGNIAIGGTLAITSALSANGGITCNTGKFNLAYDTGNTAIGGTLAVTGTLDVTGDTSVTTFDSTGATSLATTSGAVNIASAGAMTTVKGTLNVDEAVTLDSTLAVTGATTLTGALSANGGITCDTNKFTVADTTGNTTVGGTLAVTGTSTFDNVAFMDNITYESSDDVTYVVTVDGDSNIYLINGKEKPVLEFIPGRQHYFNVSHSSNNGHPLKFYYNVTSDGTKVAEYTKGVSTTNTAGDGQSDTNVRIEVDEYTPNLYYACGSHANYGSYISIKPKSLNIPGMVKSSNNGVTITSTGHGYVFSPENILKSQGLIYLKTTQTVGTGSNQSNSSGQTTELDIGEGTGDSIASATYAEKLGLNKDGDYIDNIIIKLATDSNRNVDYIDPQTRLDNNALNTNRDTSNKYYGGKIQSGVKITREDTCKLKIIRTPFYGTGDTYNVSGTYDASKVRLVFQLLKANEELY